MLDLPEDIGIEMLGVSKLLGYAQIKGLNAEGFSFLMRNFPAAGQVIPHAHFHVIPRYSDDGLGEWPGKRYKEGESKEVLRKLRLIIENVKKPGGKHKNVKYKKL